MKAIFERQLETDGAKEELRTLIEMMKAGRKVCLLCFERDPAHCHRAIVAERVEAGAGGVEIDHLHALPASFERP